MIAFLTKSDAREGFDQIVDFLNAHTILYALMVNPTIYVSYLKKFWASISVKKSNDIVKLQTLIDRKKCMSEKRTAWNEFSSSMASAVIYLATVMINAQVDDLSFHTTKYTSPALTQKVFSNIKRIGKGFSRVETPLFDAMLVPLQVHDDAKVEEDEDDNEKVANLEQDKIAQALEITKLKHRVRRLEKKRRTKPSGKEVEEESQAKAYNLDLHHSKKVLSMQDTDEVEPAKVEEVLKVVTAAKLMTDVVTTAAPITTVAQVQKASAPRRRRGVVIQDPKETAAALVIVHTEVKPKDKGKGILIEEPKPLKRQAQIDMDEAFTRQLEAELNANINWDDVMEKARKNMMIYLKNMAEFKMDFFKEKEEKEIKERNKRTGEHLEQDTTKKQRIDEEVEELKIHLQIIANDDDDVYTKATPLALKLVKERFESVEPKNFSDDFLLNTLKILFEKPNVEASIWRDQKGRYGLAKVKIWKLFESYGIHIITLTTTQMILLVEKKYPLTHLTLEQMLNNVRLKVKEENEMSLELLRKCTKGLMLLVEELVLLVHIDGVRESDDAAEKIKKLL
nr:hypothetical protein [Tanacetum cinerariifolium]